VVESDKSTNIGFKHSHNATQGGDGSKTDSIKLSKPTAGVQGLTKNSKISYLEQDAPDDLTAANASASAPASAVPSAPGPAANSVEDQFNMKLPPWVTAVVFVSKNSVSPPVQEVYPGDILPEGMMADITSLAIPDSLRGSKEQELNFMFRCRDKSPGTDGQGLTYYNCYVSYRQRSSVSVTDKSANLNRQSLVLVSKWPYPQLAFRVLSKLDEALFWQVGATGSAGGAAGSDDAECSVQALLMAGFGQFHMWPRPARNFGFSLPFLGEMLQYSTPQDMYARDGINLNLGSAFDGVNLVSMFGPLGILQHIWVLWEMVITGRNIVILATSPTQCSEVTIALASLLSPRSYEGNLRPYITVHDSDVNAIAKHAEMCYNRQQRGAQSGEKPHSSTGSIVGITDASLLNQFDFFDIALFLVPQRTHGEVDTVFKGLHSKNAALLKLIKSDASGSNKGLVNSNNLRSSPHNSFPGLFEDWISGNSNSAFASAPASGSTAAATVGQSSLPWLVCNKGVTPKAVYDRPKILKIRKMKARDRCVMGDKLLRDNFRELTRSYFQKAGSAGGVSTKTGGEFVAGGRANQCVPQPVVSASATNDLNGITTGPPTSSTASAIAAADPAKADVMQQIMTFAQEFPEWAPRNQPTLVLWGLYLFAMLLPRLFGIPALPLIIAGYFLKAPVTAPKMLEDMVVQFAPGMKTVAIGAGAGAGAGISAGSAPALAAASAPVAGAAPAKKAVAKEPKVPTVYVNHPDFSGVWKRSQVRDNNLAQFIAAQGGSTLQQKLAFTMPFTHTITMDLARTTIRLQEKCGPVDTDVTYAIHGPPLAVPAASPSTTVYSDRFLWETVVNPNRASTANLDVLICKRAVGKEYEIITSRSFVDTIPSGLGAPTTPTTPNPDNNDQIMKVESIFRSSKSGVADITTVALYTFVSPSPHAPPAETTYCTPSVTSSTVHLLQASEEAPRAKKVKKDRPAGAVKEKKSEVPHGRHDLTGVWVRSKQVNFEAFVGAQGAGWAQRKLAAAVPITHYISMDASLRAMRLQEKGGPLDIDNSFTCGDDYTPNQIIKNLFRGRIYWEGKKLVLQRCVLLQLCCFVLFF